MTVQRIAVAIVLLVALVPALVLFPPLSDADYVLFDGVGYAHHAEHPDATTAVRAGGIAFNPHHLLFHVIVQTLVSPLRALGLEHPGFVASRLLSGLALGCIWLLLLRECGRGRRAFGIALCLLLLSARGILLDAAVGETILPACAAGLWALLEGTRERPRIGRSACALALALLLRQDSVFLVPAVAVGWFASLPRATRWRTIDVALPAVGIVVALGYLAAWRAAPIDLPLREYLLGMANKGSFSSAEGFGASPAFLEWAALAWALVGRAAPIDAPDVGAVFAWFCALAAGASLVRGAAPWRRVLVAVVVCVAPRLIFFGWFDPSNWEWWLLPLVLACGVSARVASSDTPHPRAGVATALVLVAALFVGWRHLDHTWTLRERRLHDAVGVAVAQGGAQATVVTLGDRAALDLLVRGVPSIQLKDHPGMPMPLDFAATVVDVAEKMRAAPGPIVFIVDRFVRDGTRHAIEDAAAFAALERAAREPGLRAFELDGVVFGFGAKLP